MKSYGGKINKHFHDVGMPKKRSYFICLLVIIIDSVFKTGKNYYT